MNITHFITSVCTCKGVEERKSGRYCHRGKNVFGYIYGLLRLFQSYSNVTTSFTIPVHPFYRQLRLLNKSRICLKTLLLLRYSFLQWFLPSNITNTKQINPSTSTWLTSRSNHWLTTATRLPNTARMGRPTESRQGIVAAGIANGRTTMFHRSENV